MHTRLHGNNDNDNINNSVGTGNGLLHVPLAPQGMHKGILPPEYPSPVPHPSQHLHWCPQVLSRLCSRPLDSNPPSSSFQREHRFLYTRHFSIALGTTIFFGSGTSTTCTSRTPANCTTAPSPTSISSSTCLILPFPFPDIIAFVICILPAAFEGKALVRPGVAFDGHSSCTR
jgi:hypothetical protein